ncbi:MAG TPA: hypothetical protein VKU39_20950 [Streptosporangiaceae bacterium]|nr:hypothetical protein [Streptosporangiaceae bacterium]
MGKLTFGVFPLGLAGSPDGVAVGPPDDFTKVAEAAVELQGDGPMLLPRMYVSWSGPRGTGDALRQIDALTTQSMPWDLVLCYRDRSGSVAKWAEFAATVVREHGRHLAAVQVTGEANLAGIAAAADGDYPGVRQALVCGVLAAAEAKRASGAAAAIGFAVAPEVDPAATGFWTEVRNLGGSDFAGALDYAGIDAYPDVFGPRFGVDKIPMAMDWILRTFRERDLAGAGIDAGVPIRICENGWPTGPDRPEETQADVLEAVIRTTAALSDELNVTHWELFTLRDADTSRDGMFYHFGILRDDYSRKPAFGRLRALIGELS